MLIKVRQKEIITLRPPGGWCLYSCDIFLPRGDESALVCSCSGPRRNRVRGTSWWLPPPWPATGRGQRWFLRSFPSAHRRREGTQKRKRTDLSLTRKSSSPPLVLVLHLVSPTQSQEHSQQRSFL